MREEFTNGKLKIAFNDSAPKSEIEKILFEYKHEPMLLAQDEPEYGGVYMLFIQSGKEGEVVKAIKEKYGRFVNYVKRIPLRRLIV